METRQSSFEDHMGIISSAHNKTASAGSKSSSNLLEKIAQQLNLQGGHTKLAEGEVTAPGAPTAEGEVTPAASSVAGAAPAVVAATEAVAMPQAIIAGANPEESAAGEVPAATKPNEGLAISAGDGMITDANNFGRTPESVAMADQFGGAESGSPMDAEKTAEAKNIGIVIARSFQTELDKAASDRQYTEALEILKEAGLMDDYQIKDQGLVKTASFEEGGLDKIANNQAVSRNDIISAAIEYTELEKEAEYTEEIARQDAREYAASLNEENEADQEKIASAINDPQIVSAVQVLKNAGII